MAELSASQAGKDGYSFTGELSERITHLSPAILNLPFDNSISIANNILSSPDYTSFSSWSGAGVYFQGRIADNGTFGPFFGNDVYRCEKYGSATNFSYYINNISTFSVLSDYIVFTCIMKSSTTTSSYNPFSISVIKGNKGVSGEYTAGELLWRRDEYLTDGFWKLAVCLRLRDDAVPSQYRSNFSFEVTAPWANAGTYVWGCAPMAYIGTELFGYSPTITATGDYVLDSKGLSIDSNTTNYIDFSIAPSSWDQGTVTPVYRYKGVLAYKALPGSGGGGISYSTNPSFEVAAGASATFSIWFRRSLEIILPISSLLLAGAIWETSVWTTKTDMSPYLTVSSLEYYDEEGNKLPIDNYLSWTRVVIKVTNNHTDKIRFSQASYYSTSFLRGEAFFAAPQLESGDRATSFTITSRSSQGSISIPCNLKAPYTICFKYRPGIKSDNIVDAGTSPTIIQLGTYNANSSIQVQNLTKNLIFNYKTDSGTSSSQTLKTFTSATWDNIEYLYTIIADSTTAFRVYSGSELLSSFSAVNTLTYITSINIGVTNFANGQYRDLTVLPRALGASEIGDVGFSIKRITDVLHNKDVARIISGRELKEPINLLVSDWITDPLYVTGALDSTYSSYTQANCLVFLTRSSSSNCEYSYCVKRPPNVLYASQNMWGGVQLNLPERAKIEGRKYRFVYRYKGQTSKASETPYLAYLIGSPGYGVGLTSYSITDANIPANTNTKEWKTASGTYVVFNRWQKGTDNNIYDTYRQLKIGWGYEDTGSLGTKIFIDDIQIYDITDTSSLVASYSSSSEPSYPANTLWDTSGNGYNYTTTNITLTRDGPQNKLAGYFDGSSSKAQSSVGITPPCSLSFWFKPKRFPTTGSEVIFHSGTSLGTTKGYWIALKADGVVNVGLPTNGGAPEYDTSASYVALNTLYHIVLNFYPTETQLYKNGVLTHTFASGMSSSLDPGLVAGQDNASKYYMGNLSDTRIYNKVLTPADISLLYANSVLAKGDFRIKKSGVYGPMISNLNQVSLVGTAETAGDITVSGATEAYWDGTSLNSSSSVGLCLMIWNEAGVVSHSQVYNVAVTDADRTALAAKLATITKNQYWALLSYSSCGTNATLNAQMTAMNATQYASYNWASYPNSPYVAFGKGQICFKEDLRTYGNDRWYATLSLRL